MLNVKIPVNTLSFGHVGLSILHEAYKDNQDVRLLVNGGTDISAYSYSKEFLDWLSAAALNSKENVNFSDVGFNLWHLDGCENRMGVNQNLLTFHETSELTKTEANFARQQNNVFVTSRYTQSVFKNAGVDASYLPLGFDSTHFKNLKTAHSPSHDGTIVFGVFGKFEKRKHTEEVISAWNSKYGGKRGFKLNTHVYNPFFSPEQNSTLLARSVDGNKPWNINPIPFVKTLAELNGCFNACDVVIDMSGGEGFSIPSFSATALGKHAVLQNFSSLSDWGPDSGAIMVPAAPMQDVYDGHFFVQGREFNQGQIAGFNKDDFLSACDEAVKRATVGPNEQGKYLQTKWTWEETWKNLKHNLK